MLIFVKTNKCNDMANNNQQIILNTILQQQKDSIYPSLNENEYFHLFVTEQILKDYELSYDEIEDGNVDNGGDGGIDSIYTFVNSELVQRDTDLVEGKRGVIIDVFIIQSKNTNGFSETAIEKLISSAKDLFDLTKESEELKTIYNGDLLRNRNIFKEQYLHIASKFPVLKFNYFYATKGVDIHPNVERKKEFLKDEILRLFDKAQMDFTFLTATKLIDLSRKEQIRSRNLALTDNPISTQDGGYITIVPLKSYYDFISESGELIKYFFDSNIRDYQGSVEVNSEIKQTLLQNDPKEDFWWLNNGITITASNASLSSKSITIEDPQIVNGLQTSFEIFDYFKNNKIEKEERSVLVRIVKIKDEESRLKVIKSTNSQTSISPASLRATDKIHKNIEQFLFSNNFYYDRRKNYYKNQGKPYNKVISIAFLAQIVMSGLQQKPDYARARPSTLIKKNSDYISIFNESMPINLYYNLIYIQKEVDNYIRNQYEPKLTKTQTGDIRFHVTMYLTAKLTNKLEPDSQEIADINLSLLTIDQMKEAVECTFIIYDTMGGNNAVAKGREFVEELLEQLKESLNFNSTFSHY